MTATDLVRNPFRDHDHPRRLGLLELLDRIVGHNEAGAMCPKREAIGGIERPWRQRIDAAYLLPELLRHRLITADYNEDHTRTWLVATEAGIRLLGASQ